MLQLFLITHSKKPDKQGNVRCLNPVLSRLVCSNASQRHLIVVLHRRMKHLTYEASNNKLILRMC